MPQEVTWQGRTVHTAVWKKPSPGPGWCGGAYGQFGENFTVQGLADDQVCIGDRYRIGDAVFEVTQPRVTCFRVGIRMDDPQMPALLGGRPGRAAPCPAAACGSRPGLRRRG
jgi:MOSC domain-containing protein YiiM